LRILVVRTHPLADSFNAALHERVVGALSAGGHDLDRLDLYADGFDPRLSAAERARYHDASHVEPDMLPYVERLRAAQALVFVHPVWSFGVPAMLKGFFDRLLRPGVAFSIDGARVTPLLSNIRKLGVVTTYGRPRWMVFYVGDLPRRQIVRYVRWFCHRDAEVVYLAHYHMNASTPQTRATFLARVERRMRQF